MHRETLKLLMAGWSHPTLPVILHRGLLPPDPDEAEAQVARHGWRALWRDGVFDYDHFHSNAFEALGVLSGRARLRLGGPEGQPVDVTPGDLLILPPGTGHARMEASEDFLPVRGLSRGAGGVGHLPRPGRSGHGRAHRRRAAPCDRCSRCPLGGVSGSGAAAGWVCTGGGRAEGGRPPRGGLAGPSADPDPCAAGAGRVRQRP